jgi:hypothetical protein
VFALDGDVIVDGRVNGDVTALNGRAVVTSIGSVGGDVVSGDPPSISQRTSVKGDVDRARKRFALGRLGAIGRAVLRIAGDRVELPLGARPARVTARRRRGRRCRTQCGRTCDRPGVALAIGAPVVGVLLSISIVAPSHSAWPPCSLGLMYGVGYVAGCYFLGRVILREPRNRLLAFLVGWESCGWWRSSRYSAGSPRPPPSCTAWAV